MADVMTEIKNTTYKDRMKNFLIEGRTVIILLVMFIVFALLKDVFLHPQNILNLLKRTSYIAIAAFSMTFVITLQGLDLSVGSNAALTGVVLALLLGSGIGIIPAVIISFIMSIALGLLNGIISVKGKIEPFLVTLATMNIFRGITYTISSGKPIPIEYAGFINLFGNGMLMGFFPTPIVIMIILFALSFYLYKFTKYGLYVRAIGGNTEAAKVAGIRVDTIKIITFVFNASYAAVAGFILAAFMGHGVPNIGENLALDAISAVILGGTAISGGKGKIVGTVIGTLIMGVLNNGLQLLGAQYDIQILVKGIIIILAVLMDNFLKPREN